MYENASEKSCEKCNGDNFEDHNPIYSISSQKGRKRTQEDRFLVDQKFMGEGNQAVFAIFDGHSGSRASQYCKDTLVSKLTGNYEQLHENTSSTIQEVLKEIDSEFLDLAQKQNLEGGST